MLVSSKQGVLWKEKETIKMMRFVWHLEWMCREISLGQEK